MKQLIRIAPHSTELEEKVLGVCLLNSDRLEDVLEIIQTPECFYNRNTQLVFQSITELSAKNRPVDIATVTNHLREAGTLETVGGMAYIATLANNAQFGERVDHHAKILIEKFIKRIAIEHSTRTLNAAYEDEDFADVLDIMEQGLNEASEAMGIDTPIYIPQIVMEVCMDMEEAALNPGKITGVDTGIALLNNATYGWQPCEHIVIAARPGHGKTAFALNMMVNAAKSGVHVYYQSVEMGRKALVRRCCAMIAGIDMTKLRSGNLTKEEQHQMMKAGEEFSKLPITIDDKAGVKMSYIHRKAKRLKRKNKIGLIIVDYLQLIRPERDEKNREQAIAQISWAAKTMAKDLELPVIDLCQMNRAIDAAKRMPELSDLRESGAIEQDADLVAFLHTFKADDGSTKNQFVIKKYREGETNTYDLRFIPSIQKWTDADDHQFSQLPSFDNPNAGMPSSLKTSWNDTPF